MSLSSDPEYVHFHLYVSRTNQSAHPTCSFLVNSLRLKNLRNVDDPFGARLISFSPFYSSKPYVVAALFSSMDR